MTMRVSRVIQRDTSVCSRSSNPLRVHVRRDLMTDKKTRCSPLSIPGQTRRTGELRAFLRAVAPERRVLYAHKSPHMAPPDMSVNRFVSD